MAPVDLCGHIWREEPHERFKERRYNLLPRLVEALRRRRDSASGHNGLLGRADCRAVQWLQCTTRAYWQSTRWLGMYAVGSFPWIGGICQLAVVYYVLAA